MLVGKPLVKSTNSVASFIAGDLTFIKELLHPKNDNRPLNFSLAYGILGIGECSLPHKLTNNAEVYYILKGSARFSIGGMIYIVRKSDVVYVPVGEIQFIENTGRGQLAFLCIVSPPWSINEEEIISTVSRTEKG